MRKISGLVIGTFALVGCSASIDGEGDGLGRTGAGDTGLALVSSNGEVGVLRIGEALNVSAADLNLAADTVYRAEVFGGAGELLSRNDVRTNAAGGILLSTILHDVGEGDGTRAGDILEIRLLDPASGAVELDTSISLQAAPPLQVRGFNVTEPSAPHIFAAQASGTPSNAFAVGGLDPGEIGGAVHIAGDGFPMEAAGRDVDVYVARDADEWRGEAMPTAGDARYVAGPIAVHVNADGTLVPTAVFTPGLEHVGVYDLLVDVDRDGRFEWRTHVKDGADGLGKVGFTIQYSQAFLRERLERHILVNIAYDSHQRQGGEWRNEFAAGESVFTYLNPPVMHEYHFEVTKWIVRHQDFEGFWNNPAMAGPDGSVDFGPHQVTSMALTSERECTNASPTCWGVMEISSEVESFDVVYDRNGDGRYMPGEDLLDVVGFATNGDLIDAATLLSHPPEQRVGFTVRR